MKMKADTGFLLSFLSVILVVFSQSASQSSRSVYIRWGRNECSTTAERVYKGYTAGKLYNRKGSGTNTHCLPSDPTWAHHVDGDSEHFRGHIYGAEMDIEDNQRNTFGRNDCYPGWSMEYRGYLVAGRDSQEAAYDHICLDGMPEFLPHGGTNDNQHTLYIVDAKCGSLPCPPYVDGRELACVVCSK